MLKSFTTPSSERRNYPLLLRSIGIDYLQETVIRPKGVRFHQLFCCTRGKGELKISSSRYIIHPNECFLLHAGDSHVYKPLTEEWELMFIGFEGPVCESLLRTMKISGSGAYRFGQAALFRKHLEKLLALSESTLPRKRTLYAEQIFSMLVEIAPSMTREGAAIPAGGNQLVRDAVLFMEEHHNESISIRDIADSVGRTPEYLCVLFKKETGQTIFSFLTGIRVSRARILLQQEPDKSAAEIGLLCGFQSPSYFGKTFKKICGMTPNEYRLKY